MMKTGKILSCVGIMLGMSISMMMQTQLTTAMPVISREFGTTGYYSWVYSGYLLASAVTLPLFGRICDRYGYRNNYIVGGFLFLLGTLFSGISRSMGALILSRVVAGFGSGIVVPAAYGIVGSLFQKEQMRKVFGFLAVFQIFNTGLGSVLGGVFSTRFTWQLGLLILLPFELAGVLLVVLTIRKDDHMKTVDTIGFPSAMLLAPALLITMYGLEKCSDSLSIRNVMILLPGIVLLTVFMIREQKTENGILPAEVLKNVKLKGLLVEVLLMGAVLNVCFAYLPTYMVREFDWTTNTSGKVLLLYIIAMGTASMASSFVQKESDKVIFFGWGSALLGCIIGLASFFTHFVSLFLLSNLLLGIGVGVLAGTVLGTIQAEIERNSASINGIAHLMRNMGGTLGVCALQFSLVRGMGFLFSGLFVFGLAALSIQIFVVRKRRII